MSEIIKKIKVLEQEIKTTLEETLLMSDIEFQHGKYFSMRYGIFNHPRVKQIIRRCCEETITNIRKKHPGVIRFERRNEVEYYIEELMIDPSIKDKTTMIYSILLDLKEGVKKYLANNENRKLIQAYKKLIEKRCRVW